MLSWLLWHYLTVLSSSCHTPAHVTDLLLANFTLLPWEQMQPDASLLRCMTEVNVRRLSSVIRVEWSCRHHSFNPFTYFVMSVSAWCLWPCKGLCLVWRGEPFGLLSVCNSWASFCTSFLRHCGRGEGL